ncbi:MAG: hypothetical protein MJ209_00035 [archaeon]|nr:hypothetical protein [archaeon]
MNLLSQSKTSGTLLYGGVDSVFIAIDDIRIVNSKLVELNYKDDIIYNYKKLTEEDSIIISKLRYDNTILVKENNKYKTNNEKLKKQRNVCGGVAAASVVSLIITLIAK